MFEIDKKQSFVPVKAEEIIEVCYSVNTILVAPADHSAEPTKAYIVSARKGPAFVFYIFLFLVDSTRGVLYRRGEEVVSQKDYGKVLDEALVFLESMGFIMDRADLRTLAISERNEYVKQQPFLSPPPEEAAHELTEEILEEEEEEEEPPSSGAGKAGESPRPEARGMERTEQATGKKDPPPPEKEKKLPEPKPAGADPGLDLWGKILASF